MDLKFERLAKNSGNEIDSLERKILNGEPILDKGEADTWWHLLLEELGSYTDKEIIRNHSLAVF